MGPSEASIQREAWIGLLVEEFGVYALKHGGRGPSTSVRLLAILRSRLQALDEDTLGSLATNEETRNTFFEAFLRRPLEVSSLPLEESKEER